MIKLFRVTVWVDNEMERFYATWYVYSKSEDDAQVHVYQKYAGDLVDIVSVNQSLMRWSMEALSYNRASDILRNAIAKYEEQHYASGYAERYVHELVLAHFDITADEYTAITGRQ